MKKIVCIIISIILVISLIGCSKKVHHLTNIPVEISYQNETYGVTGKEIKNIGKEIGKTDDSNFKVFSIKNIETKDSIAILVTADMYPPIYYKATRE